MKSNVRRLALIVFVGAFMMVWHINSDRDVVKAQAKRKPVVITHIFDGPDGHGHAEDLELKMDDRGQVADIPVLAAQFSSRPPTPKSNAPRALGKGPGTRQFVITLDGESDVEVSGGIHVAGGPGRINLYDQVGGEHTTTTLGSEDRIVLTVTIPADAVIPVASKKLRTTSY